jgi:hypothetical protein
MNYSLYVYIIFHVTAFQLMENLFLVNTSSLNK